MTTEVEVDLNATAATLRDALAAAVSAEWTPLGLNPGDTARDLREVVESAVWPSTATTADCDAMVSAFIAKVKAEADGKTVAVLSAPSSDVFPMNDGFSAYVTALLGFLES